MNFVNVDIKEEEWKEFRKIRIPDPTYICEDPDNTKYILNKSLLTVDKETGTILAYGGVDRDEWTYNYFVLYYKETFIYITLTKSWSGPQTILWKYPSISIKSKNKNNLTKEEIIIVLKKALKGYKSNGDVFFEEKNKRINV